MQLICNVTENNGGGLALNVWTPDGVYIYAHAGYEHNPQQLRDDLAALAGGDDPRAWDGNDLTDEDNIRAARETYDNETGRTYLADEDVVYDADGNLIPLTEAEWYDDHETTGVIYHSNSGPAAYDSMGSAGHSVFFADGELEEAI